MSEMFPEEAAKLSLAGGRATAVADIVSATTWGEAVPKRIPSNISAISSSIAEWLRRMLVSLDAVAAFNVRSKRPIAENGDPSDDEGGREAGTVMAIVLDAMIIVYQYKKG